MKEFIVGPAVLFKDRKFHPEQPLNIAVGFVVQGFRHFNCHETYRILTGEVVTEENYVEGFITNKFRFLNRRKAYIIAVEAEQVLFTIDKKVELFSTDLY